MRFLPVPVFVPLLRRVVTRCAECKVPAPDHLLRCCWSGRLLKTGGPR